MSKKNSLSDYTVVDYVDEKGKLRTKVIYEGDKFYWSDKRKSTPFAAIKLTLSIVGFLIFLLPTLFDSSAMRTIYVVMPFVFNSFPLLALTYYSFSAARKKEPYTLKTCKRLFGNSKVAAGIGITLSVLSVIGFVVFWITCGAQAIDFITFVSALTLSLQYVFQYLACVRYARYIYIESGKGGGSPVNDQGERPPAQT